jgi:signal transduction histidine kinase
MRPLDPLSSIKFKLGVVILAAVAVVVVVHSLGIRANLPLVLVGIAAGALALLMVQILARGMTSPLREMVAATRAMARGDYSRRVRATSRDEVGELARAFNTMAVELAKTERLRRELVANVSHELRTPLTALRAVLENLVDEVETVDAATLRTMLGQTERLGSLVDQLLDLSQLEAGTVPLERHSFEIRPLLQQAVEESRLGAERGMAQPVRLSVFVEPIDLRANGDPERLHQVVANLVENALKYAQARVTVGVTTVNGRVELRVDDDGPGIDPAMAARVLERGVRADEQVEGTGLGLALSKKLIELHGGRIWVESELGQGGTFVFTLPVESR